MVFSFRRATNTLSAHIEHALDLPGYVPFLSSVSAGIRQSVAAYQLVVAAAMAVLYAASNLAHSPLWLQNARFELKEAAQEGLIHAVANLMRSFIENLPFINTGLCFWDFQKAQKRALSAHGSDSQQPGLLDRALLDPDDELPFFFRGAAATPSGCTCS